MNEVVVVELGVLEQEDISDPRAKIAVRLKVRRILVIAISGKRQSEA